MEIHKNYSLKAHNTFGVEAAARYFARISSEEELLALLTDPGLKNEKLLILGEGSDVLFTKDFEGLVIHNCIKGIDKIKETDEHVFLKVQGGENWHKFVRYTVENNWCGLENLSLIPGSVGAAPMQNIGAYGVELKDCMTELEAIESGSGNKKIFTKNECDFGYRESIFKNELKGKYIITSVSFRLSKEPQFNLSYAGVREKLNDHQGDLNARLISDTIMAIREEKLPYPEEIGNAGSFFKNPVIEKGKLQSLREEFPDIRYFPVSDKAVKLAAGWLIEKCGWKGVRVGQTGTYKNQALVLVNHGGATGAEIYELAKKIQQSVFDKFQIELIPEVNIF